LYVTALHEPTNGITVYICMRHVATGITLVAALILIILAATAPSNDARGRFDQAKRELDDGVVRAVVIGDSVAHGAGDERGVGIAGDLAHELRLLGRNAEVHNFGVNGARTSGTRRALQDRRLTATVARADIVVLSVGGNDLYGDRLAQVLSRTVPALQQKRILGRVEQVVEDVIRINPAARVYLLGLYNPYPRSARSLWLEEQVNRWDARLIMRFAANRQVTIIRICDLLQNPDRLSSRDRFHPGARGYAAIANRIASAI
jgi:lysophospholipase L1-like esterase